MAAFQMVDQRFKGFDGRETVKIGGRKLGSMMQDILDDLNDSPNGLIRIDSCERRAADKLIKRSNGKIIMSRSGYMKLSSVWSK